MASIGSIQGATIRLVLPAVYANTSIQRGQVTGFPLLDLEPVNNLVFQGVPTDRGTVSAAGIISDAGGAGSNVRQYWS
jgi:hypothetical protein